MQVQAASAEKASVYSEACPFNLKKMEGIFTTAVTNSKTKTPP